MSPFDFVNSITFNKDDLIGDSEILEKEYQPYIVNRSLSNFPDTLFYANQMNTMHDLDNKLQYDYLRNSISKKKRFAKWFKKDDSNIVSAIQFVYKYSRKKAEETLLYLTKEQQDKILKISSLGGISKVVSKTNK